MGQKLLLLVFLILPLHFLFAEPSSSLLRARYLGATLSYSSESKSAVVGRVRDGSPASAAGLKPGDKILSIDNETVTDSIMLGRVLQSIRDRDSMTLGVQDNGKTRSLVIALKPLPVETIEGADVTLDEVRTNSGAVLRTIITKPRGDSTRPRPGLFLAPWLSCDSVEAPFGATDGISKLIHALARDSGFVTFRVDRPGVGDSRGPDCRSLDFNTELEGYRAALRKFKTYPFVDPKRIFILGLSNGGGYAPLLGVSEGIAGYVISGGWAKTWYEHMLEIERRRLALSSSTPAQINNSMKGYEAFYTAYLISKKTPAEVIRENPALKGLWYDEPEHQYGRPAVFYQQLQDLNLAEAWQQVKVPALVVYGEYDWIMSRADHQWIAEIVNANRPGLATYVEIPRMDHGLTIQESMKGSFENFGGGRFDDSLAARITTWLKEKSGT